MKRFITISAIILLVMVAGITNQVAFGATKALETTKNAVTSELVNKKVENKKSKVSGDLPKFVSRSEVLNKQFSKIVDEVQSAGMKKLKSEKGKSVSFSYDVYNYKNEYLSVVIHTEVFDGNTSSNDVQTLVVNLKNHALRSLKDFLGDNAIEKGNLVITKAIKEDKTNSYFNDSDGFKSLTASSKFYINNKGGLVFIFNKYEIAPGSTGNPTFSMELPQKDKMNGS